jgi:plasmid stabilization system protein ParE
MYKVIVSDRAKQSLRIHIAFLSGISQKAAKETNAAIIAAIRSLSSMPERFPYLDDDLLPHNKYRKMVVDRRYLLLYQVKEQTVYIDAVVDCRQDYSWLI